MVAQNSAIALPVGAQAITSLLHPGFRRPRELLRRGLRRNELDLAAHQRLAAIDHLSGDLAVGNCPFFASPQPVRQQASSRAIIIQRSEQAFRIVFSSGRRGDVSRALQTGRTPLSSFPPPCQKEHSPAPVTPKATPLGSGTSAPKVTPGLSQPVIGHPQVVERRKGVVLETPPGGPSGCTAPRCWRGSRSARRRCTTCSCSLARRSATGATGRRTHCWRRC